MNARLTELTQFYLAHRDGEPNLFDIWERGEGRGDSVTPSTYSPIYRKWMRDKLVQVLRYNGTTRLLSLGSGNAAVESELAGQGYQVLAVDAIQEAVDLAAAKGVDAIKADVTEWTPDRSWPVVYMDGLLGHLYDDEDGLLPMLNRVHTWLTDADHPGGALIASNDDTQNGEDFQEAPGVNGFRWLSGEYLRDQMLAAGFPDVSVETFVYERPLSGERTRVVVTATVRS